MSHLIAPSILGADFGNLQQQIEMLNDSAADWINPGFGGQQFIGHTYQKISELRALCAKATWPPLLK